MTHALVTVTKNIIALVLREGSSKGIYLLLSIMIARRYGRDALGQYVLAFLFPRLFFMISEMGLNTFLTREVAKAKEALHAYLVNLGALKTLLGGMTLVAIMISARFLYPFGPLSRLICLSSLSYFVVNYLHLLNGAFRAFEKMEVEARVLILRDVLFLMAACLWLWRWQDLRVLFLFFLVSNGIALGYSLRLYRKLFGPPVAGLDLAFCRKALQGTRPIWLVYLFSILYLYVDSVMLSVFKGEAVVGLYNAAFMFVELFVLSSGILTTAFFPIFARVARHRQELQGSYRTVLKLSLFCFLPFQLCFLFFADQWLSSFFGPSFLEATRGLRILMTGGVLFVMGSVNAHCLMACGEEAFAAKVMGLLLLLNVALNLWWIPPLGLVGSSLATVLCEALAFLIFFSRIRSHVGTIPLRSFLGKLFLSGCAMVASTLALPKSLAFPVGIMIGFTGFILADLVMRGYLWQERKAIKTLWLEYGAKA